MSFSTHSFVHKLPDPRLRAVAQPLAWSVSSMASIYAGGRSSSSQISMSHSTSMQGVWGSGGLAAVMAGVLKGPGGIQSEKETMQSLNDHLASYLERVSLEADN